MKRVPGLDGLRGIAILTVVSYHAIGFPSAGFFGVDLFFVLSGYLITSLLMTEWQRDGSISLRGFWRRRARRLLPALVLYLGTLLVLALATGKAPEFIVATGIASLYTTNLFAMFNMLGDAQPWIGGLWSLAAEEQFYLVWPLVLIAVLAVGRLRMTVTTLLALAVAGFVLVAMTGTIHELSYSPLARSVPIVAGCALAVMPFRVRGGLPLGLLLFTAACLLGSHSIDGTRWFTLVAIAGAVLMVANARESRILESRALIWLGAISYSLYLWHPFFLHLIDRAAAAVVLAIAVSYASTRWVENPIRRGTRFNLSRRRRKSRMLRAERLPDAHPRPTTPMTRARSGAPLILGSGEVSTALARWRPEITSTPQPTSGG